MSELIDPLCMRARRYLLEYVEVAEVATEVVAEVATEVATEVAAATAFVSAVYPLPAARVRCCT
eukprot:2727317-Rhodomonas_salina.1